jgi:hypothetical protein
MTESYSSELERLADEQLHDDNLQRRRQRCNRVTDIAAEAGLSTPYDYYHAALVLMHGERADEFATGIAYARTAAHGADQRAWCVLAACWDRLLLAKHKPQRYGTQFVHINGVWGLGAIDPSISDAERAFYGVPPLWVQIKSAAAMQRRESGNRDRDR